MRYIINVDTMCTYSEALAPFIYRRRLLLLQTFEAAASHLTGVDGLVAALVGQKRKNHLQSQILELAREYAKSAKKNCKKAEEIASRAAPALTQLDVDDDDQDDDHDVGAAKRSVSVNAQLVVEHLDQAPPLSVILKPGSGWSDIELIVWSVKTADDLADAKSAAFFSVARKGRIPENAQHLLQALTLHVRARIDQFVHDEPEEAN